MNYSLINLYLKSQFKTNIWNFLKGVLILIPILSIIGMFSLVQVVPNINQKVFLNNSNYNSILYSKDNFIDNSSFMYIESEIAQLLPKSSGVFYRTSYSIELYLTDKYSSEILESSYFTEDNLLSGDLKSLTTSDNSLGVALTYNVAKSIDVDLGDTADLIFYTDNDEVVHYPVTVKAILKPKLNDKIEMSGLVLASKNKEFLEFLKQNNLENKFATFLEDERKVEADSLVFKKDQLKAANIKLLTDETIVPLLFAFMGGVIIFIFIFRETKFSVNRKTRSIGILLSLGTSEKTIFSILWIEQLIKILISSIIAVFITKYIIFDKYLLEYIGLPLMGILLVFYIFVGILCIYFVMKKIKTVIRSFSVADIISSKPEGM